MHLMCDPLKDFCSQDGCALHPERRSKEKVVFKLGQHNHFANILSALIIELQVWENKSSSKTLKARSAG